jgi:hypothetical protein
MVANGEGGDGRRYEVRCLAWRSGEEQVACVRLPAAVDGTADEALEVARDELRLRSGGLHATPVRALLGVTPVGSPAADASVAVEVVTTAGPRKVQVGWAGFPSPFGEGRPGRSPADPPPWPAPDEPHWVLVDETDGSAWAWDGRRWVLEDPPLTHPIPATEVELSARALYSQRVGRPRELASFVRRRDDQVVVAASPNRSEVETLERPDLDPAAGTSRPPRLDHGHQVAYGLWSDGSGWWWQDGRWAQVDPPGTWHPRWRFAAEVGQLASILRRGLGEEDTAAVADLRQAAARVTDRWRVLGYLLAGSRGDEQERRRRLLTAALTGGPVPAPDPGVAARLAARRRFLSAPPEQALAELLAAEPLLEVLAAEVEAAGRLTEISSTQRARRLSDRHPDLKERIQALVGPGSRWASRSQLPAGVAGRATTLVWDHLLDRASARPQAPAPTADARELPLVRVAALPELLAGRRLVAASVGPTGQAVLLAAPGAGAGRPADATALVLGEDGRLLQRLELDGLELERPMVQPLPDGEVVVVGARCRRFADGTAELNAQVHGPDGTQRRAFTLGDGIRDVQATTVGQLWVAYRDEGVDGSHGWGGPGGPEPIGSTGLVRFDLDGCRQWAYRSPAGLDPIGDASAMNVADEDVWLCCYPDFPLVRLPTAGPSQAWPTWLGGVRALAVDGGRVLLYGGYRDQANRCLLFDLDETTLANPRPGRLALPGGPPLRPGFLVGRGPSLHAIDATGWYRLDLRQIGGHP